MKLIQTLLLPLAVVAIGMFASWAIIEAKPAPESRPVETTARKIRAVIAHAGEFKVSIDTQGSVQSKQVIDLIPQVQGQIVFVSEKFVAGGQFEAGETILKIDPRDYQIAVISAESNVAESELRLAEEKAEAELAASEWQMLGKGEASDLTLRKPQMSKARAQLESAKANLERKKIDLERTVIKAPFKGLLAHKNVDFGQYLNSGSSIGDFYSTEILEVRLPLSNRDLGQLDLSKIKDEGNGLFVTFSASYADRIHTWQGNIVRSEGLIDKQSRIMYLVAELRGEQLNSREDGTPINIGQFVKANIEGRTFNNIFRLPRAALKQADKVLVVDENNQLRSRKVHVVESNREFVLISEGLQEGEQVNTTQVTASADGMLVSVTLEKGV